MHPLALAPPLVQCNGNGRTIMATTGSLKLPERMLLPLLVKCLALNITCNQEAYWQKSNRHYWECKILQCKRLQCRRPGDQ